MLVEEEEVGLSMVAEARCNRVIRAVEEAEAEAVLG